MSGPHGERFQWVFWPGLWWRLTFNSGGPYPYSGPNRGRIYAWRFRFWMWELRRWA